MKPEERDDAAVLLELVRQVGGTLTFSREGVWLTSVGRSWHGRNVHELLAVLPKREAR